jgi:hypothetical protein
MANGGWFYAQNKLGQKQYLIVGAGLDSQANATTNGIGEAADADAWVVDFQSSVLLGPAALLVNGAWHEWDNATFDGSTMFVEAGVMVDKVMATGKVSQQDPDQGDAVEDYTAGLHYFMHGHNARMGLEYTWGDTGATDEQILLGIQFLL